MFQFAMFAYSRVPEARIVARYIIGTRIVADHLNAQ
jgi:hypothetical protein